jgi:thiamine kinase-like enzyme
MERNGEGAARAALERLLGAATAANASVSALHGGINRRSYLITANGKQWVLQLPIPGAAGLLDVAAEAAVMRAAGAAGLAPPVAGIDATHGVLLTEYRAGARPWTPADARAAPNVVRAAALLRALHAISVHAPTYVAERFAREYLAALSAAGEVKRARLDERARGWAAELLDLARRYDAAHPPAALCHNDLVAANVLDDGDLVLVDFEYAVRGAPILDLAGLAGLNDYGERECRELLEAYFGGARAHVSLAELARTMRMVRLVAYFWARVGELRVTEAASYSELAADLERKLR